ncbi:MAG TPA: nuclear transport factor 2 family protein [Acidimicrobiia bacterium]|nr:nuclear transport factor 2 family protein [Acidimicrobiia bacterium]
MDQLEERAVLDAVLRTQPRHATVEASLQAAEDRETIRDLIMRYGYLEDGRRWDDMLALYTDDIERVLAGSLVERVQGKAVLRERLVRPVMVSKTGQAGAGQDELDRLGLRHLMVSDVIRVSDDGRHAVAAVQYTMVATREDADGFRRGSHEGSYVFEFRKEAETWKFSRQVIITDNAHNPMFRT